MRTANQGSVNFQVGNFVLFPGSQGIARVAEVADRQLLIEYFESPAEPSVGRRWLPFADVRRCALSVQTRVFFQTDNGWRAGRVAGGRPPDPYAVAMPNLQGARVHESRLRVRWERPPSGPLEVLLAGANESPYFRDARVPVRELLLRERAASGSASGILSSGVMLHPHQVNAALRIIQDPIQRYLLADEVGLGKTIQVGFVVRQLLIDDREARIGLLVPAALSAQWRAEMLEKFHLDDFDVTEPLGHDRSRFEVVAHEDRDRWRRLAECSLLVVDEAHLIANVERPNVEPYASLARLTSEVPRLLLVSATPSMQRDTTHLALLHLLDPMLYPWSELARFRQLLAVRRELAMAVFGLDLEPDSDNPELLSYQLEEIGGLIPKDGRFQELHDEVMASFEGQGLAPGLHQAELNRRVAALRTHIAETYRLHHRVIRHRRHKVIGAGLDDLGLVAPFEVTGRQRPRLIRLASHEANRAAELVQDWLDLCSRRVIDNELSAVAYGEVAAILVSRLGGPVDDLIEVLAQRLGKSRLTPNVTAHEISALQGPDLISGEDQLLAGLQSIGDRDAIRELAVSIAAELKAPSRRMVIFCGPGTLGPVLVRALVRVAPGVTVGVHLADDPQESQESVSRWTADGGILVVDHSGDAGRNFQSADVVVHVRIPWHPNVLEQRIGRVDRYGHAAPAAQFVVSDADRTGVHAGWLRCLANGFRVFDESISALQDTVDAAVPEIWSGVLLHGVEHLSDCVDGLRDRLTTEFRRVNEMDELEASFEFEEFGRNPTEDIARYEDDSRSIAEAMRLLLSDAKGFNFFERRNQDGSSTFQAQEAGQPLLSPRLMKRIMSSEASRTGVFDRWALRRLPHRRLFRRGNPFIDGIESILELDDRGQASACWRLDKAWDGEPMTYLGFDFLVEADTSPMLRFVGDSTEATGAPIRRRADSAFPPFSRRVWVAINSSEVVRDNGALGVLNARYSKRPPFPDVNLNQARISALYNVVGGAEAFRMGARRCEAAARSELVASSDLHALCDRAAEKVRTEATILAAQAEARRSAAGLLSDTDSLDLDRDIAQALLEAISAPAIRNLAVSVIVRSSESWSTHVA